MAYIVCKFKAETRDRIYKSYVSNCLQNIASNTAKSSGGSYIRKTYEQIIKDMEKKANEEQTPEQIIVGVVAKCGIKLKVNRKEEKDIESNGFIRNIKS